MKKTLSLALSAVMASALMAQTYDVGKGWSLLGATEPIYATDILTNENILNITIFDSAVGEYKHSASNEIHIIPAKAGFWVYSTKATRINTAPEPFRKLDASFHVVSDTATSWDMLEVNDLNLQVEMKTGEMDDDSVNVGKAYCKNLTLGGMKDWRVPTLKEFNALSDIYQESNENAQYFIIGDPDYKMLLAETVAYDPDVSATRYNPYGSFNYGATTTDGWLNGLYVACVRSR